MTKSLLLSQSNVLIAPSAFRLCFNRMLLSGITLVLFALPFNIDGLLKSNTFCCLVR